MFEFESNSFSSSIPNWSYLKPGAERGVVAEKSHRVDSLSYRFLTSFNFFLLTEICQCAFFVGKPIYLEKKKYIEPVVYLLKQGIFYPC